jgi:hypothetical protein
MLLEVPPFQTVAWWCDEHVERAAGHDGDRQLLLVVVPVPVLVLVLVLVLVPPLGLQTNRQLPQVPPPQTNRLLVLVLLLPWLFQSLTMVLGMLPMLRTDRRWQLAQCQPLLLLAKEVAMQVQTTHQLVALL